MEEVNLLNKILKIDKCPAVLIRKSIVFNVAAQWKIIMSYMFVNVLSQQHQ